MAISDWSFISYKKWKSSVKHEQNLKWAQIWQTNLLWPMSSPHGKLPEKRVSSLHIYTINENPFETVSWQEMTGDVPPPTQDCQRKEWALCISIPSMRTHSKQSIDDKMTGDVLPPFETARAQSDLFTVQCGQWEPIWNSQLIRKYEKIPVHI